MRYHDTVKPHKKAPRATAGRANAFALVTMVFCFAALFVLAFTVLFFHRSEPDQSIPFDTEPSDGLAAGGKSTQTDEIANFLVLGCDRSGGLNTDVMILVSFNVDKGQVHLVQIPRDTYINVGTSSRKINSLYASFYNRAQRAGEENPHVKAVSELAGVLQENLCVKIHHAITMNLDGFANIVDAVGGVYIELPQDLYYHDPTPGHELEICLKAGPQILDGEAAEQFVRYRMGYKTADIGRMDAQKLFIAAFVKQIKGNVNLSTVAAITEQVLKNVKTDMTLADCIYYAKKALSVDPAQIVMMTLPGAGQFSQAGTSFFVMHRSAAREMVNRYLNIFSFQITDAMFDKNVVFCNPDDESIKSQYYKEVAWDKVFTAEEPPTDIP